MTEAGFFARGARVLRRGCRALTSVAIVPRAAAALLGLLAVHGAPAMGATPNIVVILADDIGWGDLRVYNPASRIPTPNLDALANAGMRFTHAHASAAACAPTRYAALTGNYQWRGRRSWGTWNFQDSSQVLPGQQTLGNILGQAGYVTGFVGKWHMGGDFLQIGSDDITREQSLADLARPFGGGPRALGFDYSFALLEGIQSAPYAYFENDVLFGDPALLRDWLPGTYGLSRVEKAGRGMAYWDSSAVGADLMTRAKEFITTPREAGLPFFLYFASSEAHAPFTPPMSYFGSPVRGVTGTCPRRDMVYELDLAVGELVATLAAEGLLENTLIVFTSDNGGNNECGDDTSGPDFVGQKFQIKEGGHRVPFIVRWDGSVPAGTVRRQLIGVQDLAATLASIVGVPLGPDQARDSFNMAPVWLEGRADTEPVRRHLIAEAREGVTTGPATFAFYEGPWKLVTVKQGTSFAITSLFNLENDSMEQVDLKAVFPLRATSLLNKFKERYRRPRSAY